CCSSPQETASSMPREHVCFYSIPFQILELNVTLDCHVPRSTVNVTVISRYLCGLSCPRQQLGSHLMDNDELLCIIKFRVVSQQLPSVPSFLLLLNQTHVLHTHIRWLCLALLCHRPCHTGSLCQESSSNNCQ